MPTHLTGLLLALVSAASWGGGDFAGGLATRRGNVFSVLVVAALSGFVLLLLGVLVVGEALPDRWSMVWAAASGASGGLGIAALYRALAIGRAATVAPSAAVTGAVLPLIVASATAGFPAPLQQVGFVIAIVAIWLSSRGPSDDGRPARRGLPLAMIAGVFFGGFFVFLGRVAEGPVLAPIAIARFATLVVAVIAAGVTRSGKLPRRSLILACLAGLLDTGGNACYLISTQFTRLDVAAVMASIYPAVTVLLSRFFIKEKISKAQWIGIAGALTAIALIAA